MKLNSRSLSLSLSFDCGTRFTRMSSIAVVCSLYICMCFICFKPFYKLFRLCRREKLFILFFSTFWSVFFSTFYWILFNFVNRTVEGIQLVPAYNHFFRLLHWSTSNWNQFWSDFQWFCWIDLFSSIENSHIEWLFVEFEK